MKRTKAEIEKRKADFEVRDLLLSQHSHLIIDALKIAAEKLASTDHGSSKYCEKLARQLERLGGAL